MMKHLVLFLLLYFANSAAIAKDDSVPEFASVGAWSIRVDTTLDDSCFAVAEFEGGSLLRLGKNNTTDTIYLLVGNESWQSIERGKKYSVKIQFGNETPWTGDATGFSFDPPENQPFLWVEIDATSDSAKILLAEFMEEYSFQVFYNDASIMHVSLRDSYKATVEMGKCQESMDARNADPFLESMKSGDPFHEPAIPAPESPFILGLPTNANTAFGIFVTDSSGNIEFIETNRVPNIEGQSYGWLIKSRDIENVQWTERFTFPMAAANLGSLKQSPNITVSPDGLTVVTNGDSITGTGYIFHVWAVAEGDPSGKHHIEVTQKDGVSDHFIFWLEEQAESVQGERAAPTSIGTCFFVDDSGTAVTSKHVTDGSNRLVVVDSNGTKSSAKLIKSSASLDTAVLSTELVTPYYISVAQAGALTLGQRVFTIGYPATNILGDVPKYSEGTISALSGLNDDDSWIQMSTPIQPGNSGGALVNEKGQLVGIVTATAAVESFFEVTGSLPQNINWAIKAEYIRPLIPNASTDVQFNETQTAISHTQKATCRVIAY